MNRPLTTIALAGGLLALAGTAGAQEAPEPAPPGWGASVACHERADGSRYGLVEVWNPAGVDISYGYDRTWPVPDPTYVTARWDGGEQTRLLLPYMTPACALDYTPAAEVAPEPEAPAPEVDRGPNADWADPAKALRVAHSTCAGAACTAGYPDRPVS